MNEMKPEDVMMALECCVVAEDCKECPYSCGVALGCPGKLMRASIALIRELSLKKHSLENENEYLQSVVDGVDELVAKAKADTVRKMQERLNNAFNFGHTILKKSICDIIDQVAKELLEEET